MSATEAALRLNDLRSRVLAGEPISAEEYKEIIEDLRAARLSAAKRPDGAKARPRAAATPSGPFNPDDIAF